MGKISRILFAVLLTAVTVSAQAKTVGVIYPKKDTPWPWGLECPMFMKDISGMWAIHTADERQFTGEYLVFENTSHGNVGKEIVKIYHYNLYNFFAEGTGVIDKATSVIDGILKIDGSSTEYVLLARNFPQDNSGCHNVVTAVTFCPLSVKDCKQEPTYVLQRP